MEMTTELVEAWMQTHGIKSRIKAMLDLKFYIDLSMEKTPTAIEVSNTQLPTILPQIEGPYEDTPKMDSPAY